MSERVEDRWVHTQRGVLQAGHSFNTTCTITLCALQIVFTITITNYVTDETVQLRAIMVSLCHVVVDAAVH